MSPRTLCEGHPAVSTAKPRQTNAVNKRARGDAGLRAPVILGSRDTVARAENLEVVALVTHDDVGKGAHADGGVVGGATAFPGCRIESSEQGQSPRPHNGQVIHQDRPGPHVGACGSTR